MKQLLKLFTISCLLLSSKAFGGARAVSVSSTTAYLLQKNQYPSALKKLNPDLIFVVSRSYCSKCKAHDTILDLKNFLDSAESNIRYRLVYTRNTETADSITEFNARFEKILTATLSDKFLLKASTFSGKGARDEFTINYKGHRDNQFLKNWFRYSDIYTDYDKSHYADSKVWMLSIGINDYKGVNFENCVTDATSISYYFEYQANRNLPDSCFRRFILTDKDATKDSILHCLDYIIKNASKNDYFIFNFSGVTTSSAADDPNDTINDQIYFCPHGINLRNGFNLSDMSMKDPLVKKQLLSLKSLQQKIKFIQADKQLFIVEAGPTLTFKKEFIKGLMQDADRVLNENRIIMVPNGFGLDNVGSIQKGPINYFITSLDSATNIYDLFDEKKRKQVAYKIKKAQYEAHVFREDYFDIFYVRDFYKDVVNYSGSQATRGLNIEMDETQVVKTYASKKIALVVGTDHYNAGWPKLSNPVFDATAVKDELEKNYGYEVKLLTEASMDSIYTAIRMLYGSMDSSCQLLLYFAGHGDFESNLFDDGFIVCHDSKPLTEDPNRDTYIPFSKIRKMINKLPARQIMVVMDICYGGTFDNNILGARERKGENDEGASLNMPAMKRITKWSKYKTRIILSSVGNKPALDGAVGRHSPFATLFLKCLRNNEPGKILTATDIYSVLQQQSISEDVNNRIEPYKGSFGDNEALGEFILIPVIPLN